MIRRIRESDVESFIAIRREALEAAPDAFGSSPEEDRGLRREFVLEAIGNPQYQVMLGAFYDGLIGIAGIARLTTLKSRHKALLWGMYVRPANRGSITPTSAISALLIACLPNSRCWRT